MRNTGVVLDVTSFISAEEFILSQNRCEPALDPFARQCYAEVVQSLIFFDNVYAPHPTVLAPGPDDFGDRPLLLRYLFELGIVKPLTFDAAAAARLAQVEEGILDALTTNGVVSLLSFVDKSAICDDEQQIRGGGHSMLQKIVDWNGFQRATVDEHHRARIGTSDGVEDDPLGEWVRASAHVLEGRLRRLLPDRFSQLRLISLLARALRYTARANAKKITYQTHPLRRDFCVTFDMTSGGATDGEILDVIRAIRGIHETLRDAAGTRHDSRLKLLALELPLLGGRLWTSRELGRYDDDRWLRRACGRLQEYRMQATALRQAIARCISEEDKIRFKMEIDDVCVQLLERLGLRSVAMNETERELVRGVASVADASIGVPLVSPLLIGGKALGQKVLPQGNTYQKFVYREFVGAWRKGA